MEHSGILHYLSNEDLQHLEQLAADKKVVEAWEYLSRKGDAYAVVAADVVKKEPDSLVGKLFHNMVEVHWTNTVGEGVYRSQKFWDVSVTHLENYIDFLGRDEKDWPTTYFIEQSYKEALLENDLIAVTAIDGLLSVMQYHTGSSVSWADFMNSGNVQMGSKVLWEEARSADQAGLQGVRQDRSPDLLKCTFPTPPRRK
jgi:hypothetical protein